MEKTINEIYALVSMYLSVDMNEKTRKREVSDARKIFAYLCIECVESENTPYRDKLIYSKIGKHRTTFIHYKRVKDDFLNYDKDLRIKFNLLKPQAEDIVDYNKKHEKESKEYLLKQIAYHKENLSYYNEKLNKVCV